jgi:hypothetical protein
VTEARRIRRQMQLTSHVRASFGTRDRLTRRGLGKVKWRRPSRSCLVLSRACRVLRVKRLAIQKRQECSPRFAERYLKPLQRWTTSTWLNGPAADSMPMLIACLRRCQLGRACMIWTSSSSVRLPGRDTNPSPMREGFDPAEHRLMVIQMRDDRKADCAACETAPNGPEHQTIRGDEVKDDATMPIGPQRGWFDHAVADDDRRLMSAIERLQAVGFTVYRTAISGDRRLILTQWASSAQDLSVTTAPCTNASKWDQKRLRWHGHRCNLSVGSPRRGG